MAIRSESGGHGSGQWTELESAGWISPGWISGQIGPTRIDPYFAWAEATRYAYLHPNAPPPKIPIILMVSGDARVNAESAAQFAQHIATLLGDAKERWIDIPSVYRYPLDSRLAKVRYCTALVTAEFFRRLTEEAWLREAIARFELCLPVVTGNDFKTQPRTLVARTAFQGVVVGVIDDGLAYLHERFRNDKLSRIESFWDQEEIAPTSTTPGYGAPPAWFDYGWELRKGNWITNLGKNAQGIDQLISDCSSGGRLDEDEGYRRSTVTDNGVPANRSIQKRAAHGTHVMDLAAGWSTGDAGSAHPIIAVQLPSRTTRDTSGSTLYKQALDAIHYILARAHDLAADANSNEWPVVINLSYGMIAGPHDGTGMLEAAMDELIDLRAAPLEIVLPEGNSHLSRCHAHFLLAHQASETLDWRVLPDDATPSFMEIWLPRTGSTAGTPQVEIQVTTPSGAASPWVASGSIVVWQLPGSGVLCLIAYLAKVAQSDRAMIWIGIAPTATLDPTRAVSPSGLWKVGVRNVGPEIVVDAWIQRDDTPFGYPIRGRQSRFEHPGYRYRDDITGRLDESDAASSSTCYIRRASTQNAIANGYNTVVMGGFRRTDWWACPYSACGPILPPSVWALRVRDGPDAMAVSEDSPAQYGVLAAGTRSGSVFAMNGTSVAAPQITRWIANQMAVSAAASEYWKLVDTFAAQQELFPPPPGTKPGQKVPVPPERMGFGRIPFAQLVHRRNGVGRSAAR